MGKHLFEIRHQQVTASYSDVEQFLAGVETALRLHLKVSVAIALSALPVIDRINELFIRHGLVAKVNVAQSDERALDYIASATAGGLAGGTLGSLVGWLTLVATRAPVLPTIGIPLAVLAGIGAIFGLIATRRGYSITAYLREDRLEIDLIEAMPLLA